MFTHTHCSPASNAVHAAAAAAAAAGHARPYHAQMLVVQATHRALAEHAKRDPYGAFHIPAHCPQFGTAAAATAASGGSRSTAYRAGAFSAKTQRIARVVNYVLTYVCSRVPVGEMVRRNGSLLSHAAPLHPNKPQTRAPNALVWWCAVCRFSRT